MNLMDKILEKLGLQRRPAPTKVANAKVGLKRGPAATKVGKEKFGLKPDPAPTSVVDVVGKLEGLAASNPQKLNWKTSIVDLLKLLGLESSLEARKELATELRCPPEKMGGDYAAMNIWLHKTVLRKLAENGGNIPKKLLD